MPILPGRGSWTAPALPHGQVEWDWSCLLGHVLMAYWMHPTGESAAAVRVQTGERERRALEVVGVQHQVRRDVQDGRQPVQRGVRREGAPLQTAHFK